MDDVKGYLRQVRHQDGATQALLEQIETLRQGRMSAAARIGDGLPHAHDPSDLSGYAARLDELERKLMACYDSATARKARVIDAIEGMSDPQEQEVLVLYYLGGKTWEEVADKMGYSLRQIHYIHGRALQHIELH